MILLAILYWSVVVILVLIAISCIGYAIFGLRNRQETIRQQKVKFRQWLSQFDDPETGD